MDNISEARTEVESIAAPSNPGAVTTVTTTTSVSQEPIFEKDASAVVNNTAENTRDQHHADDDEELNVSRNRYKLLLMLYNELRVTVFCLLYFIE